MTEKNESSSLATLNDPLTTFGADSVRRLTQTFKIINANSLADLETKVNYFLTTPGTEGYQVHGDIQTYSYQEFVQSLVGYKYVD